MKAILRSSRLARAPRPEDKRGLRTTGAPNAGAGAGPYSPNCWQRAERRGGHSRRGGPEAFMEEVVWLTSEGCGDFWKQRPRDQLV